uniref:Uncharacterized protein n=1 Tax=Oryza rufipogon TaxID=4529 RepID=A0A0E0Q8A7_ORYRU
MAACSRRQSRAFHRRARSAALGRWRSKLASVWSTPFRLCSKPTNSSNRNPQPDLLHLSPTLDLYLTICWLLPWKDKGHLMLAFLTIISFPSVHSCIPSHAKPGADLRQGRPQLCVVQRPIPIQNIPVGQSLCAYRCKVNEGYKQPTNLLLLGATKALFFWRNGKNLFQRMVIDSHNTGAEAVCPLAIDAAQQSRCSTAPMVIDSHNTGAEAVCPFAIDAAQQSRCSTAPVCPQPLVLEATTLPSPEEMLRAVEEYNRAKEAAGLPKRQTHDLFLDLEYCDEYGERHCGFPRTEQWKKELIWSSIDVWPWMDYDLAFSNVAKFAHFCNVEVAYP